MKKISKKTYFLAAVLSSLVLGPSLAAQAEEQLTGVKAVSKTALLETEKDFDKAYEAAKKDGKTLMLEFAGLDWCPPCKMLHKFVVNTDEFAKYAKQKLHVVMADFKRGGEPSDKKNAKRHLELSEKYKLRYFPTIVLINPKNDNVEIIEGLQTKTPRELIEKIETFRK
mgnify:FL=1